MAKKEEEVISCEQSAAYACPCVPHPINNEIITGVNGIMYVSIEHANGDSLERIFRGNGFANC
jgi:hypothetical protein